MEAQLSRPPGAYLASLRLPPEGTACPQQGEPFGPANGPTAEARRTLDSVRPLPLSPRAPSAPAAAGN
jgi:hypothetical protein